MPPLTAIERFFERLLERPSARLFRARLQPVQLQRRIERAMEAERLASADRTLVPNRFVVHLNPVDLDGFGEMTGSLASELADGALLFARSRHYTLVDRPRVDLLGDPTVERTDIRVIARFADPISGRVGAAAADDVGGAYGGGPSDTMVRSVPSTSTLRAAPPATVTRRRARGAGGRGTVKTIVSVAGHPTRWSSPSRDRRRHGPACG